MSPSHRSEGAPFLSERPTGIIIVSAEFGGLVYDPAIMRELHKRVNLVSGPVTREDVAQHPELLRDVEVIFSSWAPPKIDAAFLKSAPKLRAFFYAAGLIDTFVTDSVWARGIRVTSAIEINSRAVAEYTLAAILFSLKRGFHLAAACRQGRSFARSDTPTGIYGSTVALIALGRVGRAVREKLRGFDVRVVAYDPFITAAQAAALGVEKVGLNEAFSSADVVSLHVPTTPDTAGMITGAHFASMRPGSTFINTARGTIVRQDEMLQCLARRPDITAILDVTEPEPPAADSPLFDLPNIVLTPHIAGALGRDCARLGRAMLEEYDRLAAGQPLLWEVKHGRTASLT